MEIGIRTIHAPDNLNLYSSVQYWLGINVVVLKGVSIGKNSMIGANSVVTRDIPENTIAGGNPCKVLKHI